MASPHELHRQGKQNKNDIERLYELNDETNKKVHEIDAKVTEIDAKVTEIDAKVTEIDGKVTVITEVQQDHGRRLDAIDATQGEHGSKLDEILEIVRKAS